MIFPLKKSQHIFKVKTTFNKYLHYSNFTHIRSKPFYHFQLHPDSYTHIIKIMYIYIDISPKFIITHINSIHLQHYNKYHYNPLHDILIPIDNSKHNINRKQKHIETSPISSQAHKNLIAIVSLYRARINFIIVTNHHPTPTTPERSGPLNPFGGGRDSVVTRL